MLCHIVYLLNSLLLHRIEWFNILASNINSYTTSDPKEVSWFSSVQDWFNT